MSTKDLNRLEVLTKAKDGLLKQVMAAQTLDLSPRLVRRLLQRLEAEGPRGVVSRKVGAPIITGAWDLPLCEDNVGNSCSQTK